MGEVRKQVPSTQVRVYVGGFGSDAREPELRAAFRDVGVELERIEVVMSTATGCSRGFAFVVLAARSPALASGEDSLLDRMGTAMVDGRALTIHRVPSTLMPRQLT